MQGVKAGIGTKYPQRAPRIPRNGAISQAVHGSAGYGVVYDVLPKPPSCYPARSVSFPALHRLERILKRLRAFSSIHWLFEFSAYSMPPPASPVSPPPSDGWLSLGATFSSPRSAPALTGYGSQDSQK